MGRNEWLKGLYSGLWTQVIMVSAEPAGSCGRVRARAGLSTASYPQQDVLGLLCLCPFPQGPFTTRNSEITFCCQGNQVFCGMLAAGWAQSKWASARNLLGYFFSPQASQSRWMNLSLSLRRQDAGFEAVLIKEWCNFFHSILSRHKCKESQYQCHASVKELWEGVLKES